MSVGNDFSLLSSSRTFRSKSDTFVDDVALSSGQLRALQVVCTSAVRYLCGHHPVSYVS